MGAAIVDLAKYQMFFSHYIFMIKHLDCCFLYSDTVSFVFEIRIDDLYEEFARNGKLRKEFDFPNLSKNHPCTTAIKLKLPSHLKTNLPVKFLKNL